MQPETGCPAASRRNGWIVELGTLGVGWGAARFGKDLERRIWPRAPMRLQSISGTLATTQLTNIGQQLKQGTANIPAQYRSQGSQYSQRLPARCHTSSCSARTMRA